MTYSTCPGQDRRFWKPSDIRYENCPTCGRPIEFWKDDVKRVCLGCHQPMINPRFDPGCARWCPYAEKCLGDVALAFREQPGVIRDRLEGQVRRFHGNDKGAVDRTLSLVNLADRIMKEEGGNPLIILSSAFLMGIPKKDAEDLLRRVGLPAETIKEVTDLFQALETGEENSTEFRVLWDAFLLFRWIHHGEGPKELRTSTGRRILQEEVRRENP